MKTRIITFDEIKNLPVGTAFYPNPDNENEFIVCEEKVELAIEFVK